MECKEYELTYEAAWQVYEQLAVENLSDGQPAIVELPTDEVESNGGDTVVIDDVAAHAFLQQSDLLGLYARKFYL